MLAAHRGGITTVIIPSENEKDLVEIPKNIKSGLEIVPVRWIDEVISVALERAPENSSAAVDEVSTGTAAEEEEASGSSARTH